MNKISTTCNQPIHYKTYSLIEIIITWRFNCAFTNVIRGAFQKYF
jgi:hypothetical protein